jgi:hypothetical protein
VSAGKGEVCTIVLGNREQVAVFVGVAEGCDG